MFDIYFTKLNLQLFAGNPNTNVTTDAGLSAENKTHYDMTLIDEAGPYLVHDQFGQKRPIPKNGGKKIEFRKYASFPKALTPLTEGVTPDGRKLSVTTIEAEVAQYGDYVTLSDVLDLTTIDNNVVEATKLCGRQAGLTLDTVTRNVLQSGTYVFYCGS
jgi:N4-gp56 family major capsid protein